MLELIRRCRYCRREMNVSAQSHAENPYCNQCLPERLTAASAKLPPSKIERRGNYLVHVPIKD